MATASTRPSKRDGFWLPSTDARAIAPIVGAAYAHDPMQVARMAASTDARARHVACVSLSHWVCDGLAELEAIAVLLGCARLGELDAAIANALEEWRATGSDGVPRLPVLAPAIDAVVTALVALCARGASGGDAVAVVSPIVELVEMMRIARAPGAPAAVADSALSRATAQLRAVHASYRDELAQLGEAIDRAGGEPGDRIAVALGVAARANQVAVIAASIAAWIGPSPANAAQIRWRAAHEVIERVLAGTLAGVRQLVPLPP